jgi:hypothetical protein
LFFSPVYCHEKWITANLRANHQPIRYLYFCVLVAGNSFGRSFQPLTMLDEPDRYVDNVSTRDRERSANTYSIFRPRFI